MDAPCLYVDGKGVATYEDYKEALRLRHEFDEEKPYAAVVLLADSQLMFWKEEGYWWVNRLRCELPSRALEYDGGEASIKAAYIGAGTDDAAEFYDLFKASMGLINITDCMHIHADPTETERAHLEQSDIILLGGGDIDKTHAALTPYLSEAVKWRYYDGAVIIAVGTSATLLGRTAWRRKTPNEFETFPGINLIPVMVGDAAELPEVAKKNGYGSVGLGLSKGGGVLFNTDGSFEPCKEIITEVHYRHTDDKVTTSMVAPPEKGQGMLVAVERFEARLARRAVNNVTEQTAEVEGEGEETGCNEPEPTPVHVTRAESIRALGNQAFAASDHHEALKLYRSSFLIDKTNVKTSLNITAALLKLNKLDDAFTSANLTLALCSGKVAKAWYRRASVLAAKGQYTHAEMDLMEAAVLEPKDLAVRNMLDDMQRQKETEPGWVTVCPNNNGVLEETGNTKVQLPQVVDEAVWGGLEVVSLKGCWLRQAGCKRLANIVKVADMLVEVNLCNNAVGDCGVRALVGSGLLSGTLQRLDLSYNNLTDDVLPVFEEDTVQVLNLAGNRLGFGAAAHFCRQTRNLTKLLKLNLAHQHPPLKHDALWRLFPTTSSNLQELDLRGAPLDSQTAARLRMRLKTTTCLVFAGTATAPSITAPLY